MKRFFAISFSVVLCILLTTIVSPAYAYSGSDYTSNSSLATKIDNLIQGNVAIFSNTSATFKVGSSLNNDKQYYWKNGYYSGYQCYAYGQAAYYYLFGDVPYHGGGGYSNSKVISGVKGRSTLSYDVLSGAGVGCGAYIRTTVNSSGAYSGSGGHSMLVLTYDSSSITILHGNANGSGLVSINTYTWSKFNSTHLTNRGRYVSHIVQPNLTANTIGSVLNLPSSLTVEMGKRTLINATGNYSSLSWSSSNTDVAIVTSDGRVFGNRPGTATITATADNGTTDTCSVTVTEPSSVYDVFNSGSQLSGWISSDDERAFIVGYTPTTSGYYVFESRYDSTDTYGYVYDQYWNLLDYDDDSGENLNFMIRIYMNAGSTYYLVGRFYNVSLDAVLTIGFYKEEIPVSVPASMNLTLGYRNWLDFSFGSASSVNWSSSDASIVKVDGGYVYAVGLGTAVVTLTDASDSSNTAQCTVTVVPPTNVEQHVVVYREPTRVAISSDDDKCAEIYAFTAPVTTMYDFYTDYSSDSYGVLFDSDWNLIAQNDDGNGNRDFRIQETLQEGETYYILVRGFSVTSEFETALYAHYFVNSQYNVPLDTTIMIGNDAVPGYNHFYTFTPSESGKYVFSSTGTEDGMLDTYGYIYDVNFNLLASNDDDGKSLNFCVTYDMIAGETYYLRSRLYYAAATDQYSITVSKYRPVAYIYCYFGSKHDITVGETVYIACSLQDENYKYATNQSWWCEEIDNDICSVTRDGCFYAKSNGVVDVTVHAEENPDIVQTVSILIHDEIQYSYTTDVDEEGVITFTFSGIPNNEDKLMGFVLYSYNTCLFDFFGSSLPGYTDSFRTDIHDLGNGQAFLIIDDQHRQTIDADQTLIFRIAPQEMDALWNTTQSYSLTFIPYTSPIGEVYGAEVDVWVEITFPAKPTPLTVPDFVIPSGTKIIENEAFSGISAKRIKLPEGITTIGSQAFANCLKLEGIYIPEGCTSIATDAFANVSELTIYGQEGSYAEFFAEKRGFSFEAVN